MRVLVVHNQYRQRGGEDVVVASETALLRGRGHDVVEYREHNDRVRTMGAVQLAAETVWSRRSRRRLEEAIERYRPDVVDVHNTFPLISPAAYHACRSRGVPVVQRLHNYRLLCPGTNLVRGGRVCEACVGRAVPWPGVAHGCYRASRVATTAVASMLTTHRVLGTWTRCVDLYVPPSRFAREKFVAGGLPPEKLVVKPNFVAPDPGAGGHEGDYALFVGRLSAEKGVDVLVDAWRRLESRPRLRVVGGGPLASLAAGAPPEIEWLGPRSRDEVVALMQEARVLVVPSRCYETFGLVLVEAYATGLPVIAARHGAMAELVEEGRTGFLFEPGDADALAHRVEAAFARPARLERMGREARRAYVERYTADRNYELILGIYRKAIAHAGAA